MKRVFAGPSVYGLALDWRGIDRRPPAAQGDIFDAVAEGAVAIGLIDGLFGATASVWHKEILHALSLGVRVVGGASMGALRAAECQSFGMLPVGVIAQGYATGRWDDDALVAVTHGPAELDHAPLTDALIDMLATFDALAATGEADAGDLDRLRNAARACFFEELTIDRVLRDAGLADRRDLLAAYRAGYVSLKQHDARAVVEAVRALPETRGPAPAWTMETPPTWRAFVASRASSAG